MEVVSGYIFRLVCGSIICALVLVIGGTAGVSGQVRKLICGLFLFYLALSPLKQLNLDRISFTDPEISRSARRYAKEGKEEAAEAIALFIKDQCASYILTKGAELSVSLDADVYLEEQTGIPVSVKLYGAPTPYEKEMLTDYIIHTLGIERSEIHWNPRR